MDRDVSFRGKYDGNRCVVGRGGDGQGSNNRVLAGENWSGIDRDNEGSSVFAMDVADTSGRGGGNNAGDVAALTDVTRCDFKAEGRVITFDELSDGIETIEWVIGDIEVQRRQQRVVGGNSTVEGQMAERNDIRGAL